MRRFWIICLGLWLGLTLRCFAQPNVTGYAKMTAQIKSDAARCPFVRVMSLGKSANGRDLWLVRLAEPAADPAQMIRVLVLCRQHGDEPASTEAALGLIHRLAAGGDPSLRGSLAHVSLYLLPMVNPDGAEANTRSNGVGADLNRDWGIFHQPETRAVAKAARLLRPNLVIDAHNWDGNDEYNADCLEIPRETATPLGRTSHVLQRQAVQELAGCGYAVHPTAWGADTDARLAHRWFTRQHVLSALVETHSGSPADVADFQRRQGMYAALIHSLVRRYAAFYTVEKPALDALESDVPGNVRENALFPPVSMPPARRFLAALRPVSYAWLWAIGIYGLSLWGAGIKRTQLAPSSSWTKRCSSRFRKMRSKVGRGFSLLPPPRPRAKAARSIRRPSRAFREWRQPLAFATVGAGTRRVPKPARYSFAKKRDGTDTKARSGQRKAVSIPPR